MKQSWKYYDFEGLSVQEEFELIIKPREYNSKQFIRVEKGQRFQFKVDPKDSWKDWFRTVSVNGFNNIFVRNSKLRMPENKCFTLCGTIEANDDGNFRIGSNLIKTFNQNGDLHFFANDKKDFKHIDGGFVFQDADKVKDNEVKEAKLVSKNAATAEEMKDLEIAYKVASLTKSNCVVYVKNSAMVAVGMGIRLGARPRCGVEGLG